jgi:hypothetical protein
MLCLMPYMFAPDVIRLVSVLDFNSSGKGSDAREKVVR